MADRDTEISRDGTPGARTSLPGAEPSTRSRARRKLEVHTEPRVWLYPFLLLAGASVRVMLLGRLLDADGRGGAQPALRALFSTPTHDPTELNANVGAIVTGILGVAISVVAIIVELASNRYTHRITGLFFRAPVNFAVLGTFVVSGIQGMWVAFGVRSGFVPVWGTTLAMGLMTLSLLLLLPYFAFVFDFLDPLRIVARIRAETLSVITRGPRLLVMARMSTEDVQRHAADGAEHAVPEQPRAPLMVHEGGERRGVREGVAEREGAAGDGLAGEGELVEEVRVDEGKRADLQHHVGHEGRSTGGEYPAGGLGDLVAEGQHARDATPLASPLAAPRQSCGITWLRGKFRLACSVSTYGRETRNCVPSCGEVVTSTRPSRDCSVAATARLTPRPLVSVATFRGFPLNSA